MFTGIIKETGTIKRIITRDDDIEIEVSGKGGIKAVKIGDSISVNGICLTVKSCKENIFSFDVSSNTLNNTDLRSARANYIVNLEDSLAPGDKLGGHFVAGHVDSVNKLLDISREGRSFVMTFSLDPGIRPFIAPRGSIAINGISLTVTDVKETSFKTVIIPHTYKNTNLMHKNIGDTVNIEIDLLARYIINYLDGKDKPGKKPVHEKNKILKEKLSKYGFTK